MNATFTNLAKQGLGNPGCLGPRLRDRDLRVAHGFAGVGENFTQGAGFGILLQDIDKGFDRFVENDAKRDWAAVAFFKIDQRYQDVWKEFERDPAISPDILAIRSPAHCQKFIAGQLAAYLAAQRISGFYAFRFAEGGEQSLALFKIPTRRLEVGESRGGGGRELTDAVIRMIEAGRYVRRMHAIQRRRGAAGGLPVVQYED